MKNFSDRLWVLAQRLRLELARSTYDSIPFIVSGVASALVCSAYTALFKGAEKLSFSFVQENPVAVFILSPVCFVGAWLLVHAFAPGAVGSGIPQVLASLDEQKDRSALLTHFLAVRVFVVKIFSSSLLALGGGAVGREGPSLQISAAIFYNIRIYWNRLGNKLMLKNMLVAGGAGGIAAAFNTPLGGIIYAVEELARDHVSNFRIGLLEAVITAGLVAQLINGPYLFLGFPVLPEFKVQLLPAVVIVAALCGLGGALFGRFIFWAMIFRRRFTFKGSLFLVIAVSFLVATYSYFFGNWNLGSGHPLIGEILFRNHEVTGATVVGRFFAPVAAALSGAAGGIFAPSLAAGAALGEVLARFMENGLANLAPICGMIGFLTGVTRAPVTSFVLILEMTDRHSAVFPMMFSALIAAIFAQVVERKSFYHKTMDRILSEHAQLEKQ